MDINSLDRFLEAQEQMYDIALKEIQNGEKESHWIWYIFPQLRGLGRSQMAYAYGINGMEEAKAYLEHPILSKRLIEITEALLLHKEKDIYNLLHHLQTNYPNKGRQNHGVLVHHVPHNSHTIHHMISLRFQKEFLRHLYHHSP